MSDQDLTYCFSRTIGDRLVRIGHYGPHQVGLGLVLHRSVPIYNGRWVLERAIKEIATYEDAMVLRPLLNLPEIAPYFVKVSDEQVAALRRVLSGAREAWAANKYADSDREDDRLLATLAVAGTVTALGVCLDLRPVEMP